MITVYPVEYACSRVVSGLDVVMWPRLADSSAIFVRIIILHVGQWRDYSSINEAPLNFAGKIDWYQITMKFNITWTLCMIPVAPFINMPW